MGLDAAIAGYFWNWWGVKDDQIHDLLILAEVGQIENNAQHDAKEPIDRGCMHSPERETYFYAPTDTFLC